jgi:hypothetical protein
MTPNPPLEFLWSLLVALFIASRFSVEYTFLKYVDLGQFARLLKNAALEWLAFAAFYGVLLFIESLFPSTTQSSFLREIPLEVWFVPAVAVLTWLFRGTKITFPETNVRQWVVLNLFIFGMAAVMFTASFFLPENMLIFVALALWEILTMYVHLIETGKDNYMSMKALMEQR